MSENNTRLQDTLAKLRSGGFKPSVVEVAVEPPTASTVPSTNPAMTLKPISGARHAIDTETPQKVFKRIAEEAEIIRQDDVPDKSKPDTKPLAEAERVVPLDKEVPLPRGREGGDLYDAIQVAEMLEESCTKDGEGYVVREGWDIHTLLHSVVVLYRAYKDGTGK